MGAGLGGSTAKNVNVNANTGGGDKKQGLSTTTNKRVQFVSNAIKTRSYGEHRNFVFCMNQLGGVGAVGGGNGSRMFGTTSDGVKDCITGPYGCEQVVREAYLEAYGREPDKSGLRTYCIAMTKRRWSKADVIADLEKNGDSFNTVVQEYPNTKHNAQMIISQFDLNNDGVLEGEDEAYLAYVDTNNDGKVSDVELTSYIINGTKEMGGAEILDFADTNNDGVIDKDEYDSAVGIGDDQFDRSDSNVNGILDTEDEKIDSFASLVGNPY